MNKRFSSAILVLCLSLGLAFTVGVFANEGLDYINRARKANGLPLFQYQSQLNAGALAHCDYAQKHQNCSHEEQEGEGFTGRLGWDRAKNQGYASRRVSEQVAFYENWLGAAEQLLSGIYHRIGLLEFGRDEIGLASTQVQGRDNACHCILMGHSPSRLLCENSDGKRKRGYYGLCNNEALRFSKEEYDIASSGMENAGPEFVIYPWPEQGDVLPVFANDEIPSPFSTDIRASGNPVSIQFNPERFKEKTIQIKNFLLQDENDQHVLLYPRFDANTDPNKDTGYSGAMTPFEFAWFPVSPLRWDHQYSVTLSYSVLNAKGKVIDGKTLSWHFQTRFKPHTVPDGDGVVFMEPEDRAIRAPANQPLVVILESDGINPPDEVHTFSAYGTNPSFEGFNVIRFTPTSSGTFEVFYSSGRVREISIELKDEKTEL